MLLLVVLVNLTPVQNFLVRKATEMLSKKLDTKVSVQHVRIDFLNHLLIQGVYVEDKAADTLLYAGELGTRITDWFIFKKEVPVLQYVQLKDAYVHLYRTTQSDEWNYQFVIDALDSGPKKKKKNNTTGNFEIDLEKVKLQNVRFHMDDAWSGSDFDLDVGNLLVDADEVNLKKKNVKLNVIALEKVHILVKDYETAKGYLRKVRQTLIDTTAFNPLNWQFSVKKITLNDSRFVLNTSSRPALENEFDPEHIDVSHINFTVENGTINADTITGSIKQFSAQERCGLVVKNLRADVTVSPNASICDNLFLETNRSRLQRYYAMHYTRFPDFLEYIDKVRMTGDLRNAHIDYRDVAFFAPALHQLPAILNASGRIEGTVDSIVASQLSVSDGDFKLSGNLFMMGLPDINNTFIRFDKGSVFAKKETAFKYFPTLKNFRTIDFDALGYIDFKGGFVGYMDRFATNGTLHTALGSVVSDVQLSLPNMDVSKAVYSGTISSQALQVGKLFRQPSFGAVSLHVKVDGKAFDPQNASVKLSGDISSLEVLGYRYTNINAEGVLAQKKFDGQLLINDPNLALAFYGTADFSQKQLQINAKANLLNCNLRSLNLSKDSITVATDFDLDFTGNNIDEFIGYSKLYNLNMYRNGRRLDVDSIYLNSTIINGKKRLALESNIAGGHIEGNYLLSRLPYSFQYYISGYLPNYISAPVRYAPDQDINYYLQTRETDSLLAVIMPGMKGFNNATISGTLNTNQQYLRLNANIPYGYINGIYFDTATITASGNFNQLLVKTSTEKLALGDGLVTAAFRGNALLGNDSLSFHVSTDSKDDYGTAKIEGHAFASGDSLYLRLAPSEFFLNKYRWEIPSGNRFVFAANYLSVKDLVMKSGGQQIAINSFNESSEQGVQIKIDNFDLASIGNIANIALYEPGGNLNGAVTIKDIYRGIKLQSDVVAEDVKFGSDTIGRIKLVGALDVEKELLTLHPTSGIYSGKSSLTAGGKFALDSTNNQRIDGYLKFNDADVNWVHPFVSDFLSHMTGTLNGTITLAGTAFEPDVNGAISLSNAGTRIDIIGTYYRIPAAIIQVDNRHIDFGKIAIFDRFGNNALLTGGLRHDRFRNIRFDRISVTSPKLEVLNLNEKENTNFYGNLIANVSSFTLAGTIEDVRMNIRATPAEASHIYIPMQSSTDISTYSYISFRKQPGQEEEVKPKVKNKFSLSISGDMNPLATLTMVIDPVSGDLINAKGNGNITLSLPANEDMKMYGNYEIENGNYMFNFKKLFFVRNFKINQGSRISFNGPLSHTNLDINAIYTTRLRPSDILNDIEKNAIKGSTEWTESSTRQDVNVLLNMTGSLDQPVLNFKLDLDRSFEGTLVGNKIAQINQDYATLFDQVASLLLIGTFIPSGGLLSGGSGSSSSASAAVNSNFGDVVSSTVSSQLTNIMSKLLNDPSFAIELKYNNYSYSSDMAAQQGISRNEVKVGIKKNFFNNRVLLELGSAYDWGRPTSSGNTSGNLNLAGDFRAQYLLTKDGKLRLNMFRTNSYDILMNDNVYRGGIGISYRTSFNGIRDFFGMSAKPKKQEIIKDTIRQENIGQDASGAAL